MFRAYTVATEDPLCVLIVIERIDAAGNHAAAFCAEARSGGPLEPRLKVSSIRRWLGYPTNTMVYWDDDDLTEDEQQEIKVICRQF